MVGVGVLHVAADAAGPQLEHRAWARLRTLLSEAATATKARGFVAWGGQLLGKLWPEPGQASQTKP